MPEPAGTRTPLPPVLQGAIDKFREWAEHRLQVEQEATNIEAPLYHYTDGNGLKGILESGRVWFTDYRHLNDPSELTHGIDTAREVAQKLGTGADGRVRLFLENFVDLFRHDNFAGTLEFFIASFSRARDDLGRNRSSGIASPRNIRRMSGRVVALVRPLVMPLDRRVEDYPSGCIDTNQLLRTGAQVDRWPVGWPSEVMFYSAHGGPRLRDAVYTALHRSDYGTFTHQFLQGPIDLSKSVYSPLRHRLMQEVRSQIHRNPETLIRPF